MAALQALGTAEQMRIAADVKDKKITTFSSFLQLNLYSDKHALEADS